MLPLAVPWAANGLPAIRRPLGPAEADWLLYTQTEISRAPRRVAQHAQSLSSLGTCPARLLHLLRARLAALGGSALPGEATGPIGAQPRPRLLEPAASKATEFPAVGHSGGGRLRFERGGRS